MVPTVGAIAFLTNWSASAVEGIKAGQDDESYITRRNSQTFHRCPNWGCVRHVQGSLEKEGKAGQQAVLRTFLPGHYLLSDEVCVLSKPFAPILDLCYWMSESLLPNATSAGWHACCCRCGAMHAALFPLPCCLHQYPAARPDVPCSAAVADLFIHPECVGFQDKQAIFKAQGVWFMDDESEWSLAAAGLGDWGIEAALGPLACPVCGSDPTTPLAFLARDICRLCPTEHNCEPSGGLPAPAMASAVY